MTSEEKAAVAEDLLFLRKYLDLYLRNWRDDPPLDEVRRGSVILRRLLADRELVRAWQAAGFAKEPQIAALDLEAAVRAHGSAIPEFALAGAARYTGMDADAAAALGKSQSGAPRPPAFRTYTFSDYLESPSIYLGKTVITRREIIRYMAYKSGDSQRAARQLAERFGRLEAKANGYRQDAFMLELISIGQTLAQTPDVVKLMQALRSGANPGSARPAPRPAD